MAPVSLRTLLVITGLCCMAHVGVEAVFSECGGTLRDEYGTIQSPNFPGPFPIPINCRWLIHAPNDSKIVIYFTQYFLRHSFFITEYDKYDGPQDYYNKNSLGEFDAEDHITSLVAYRQYVSLDLVARDTSNLHLRVEEFLRDVHGFNITYNVVPRDEDVVLDTCSVHECSYLGNCLASSNYSSYACSCFNGFYGKGCEKGPHCDPEKGKNMCLNGGKCRYFYGSLVNVCECPPGYNGPKCENEIVDTFKEECEELKCSHFCKVNPDTGDLVCACNKGFRLKNDGISCVEEEHYRISVELPVVEQEHVADNLRELLDNLNRVITYSTTLLHLSGLGTVADLGLDYISVKNIGYHFYVEKNDLALVNTSVQNLIRDNSFFGVLVDAKQIVVEKDPVMKLLSVENSDEGPALEGGLMTLVCTARGSDKLQFRWFKDGRAFNMTLTHRNAWEIRLPETIGEKQISVLNIDGVTTYDKGEFTCEISDFGHTMNASVLLDVLPMPQVEVTPLTACASKGSSQSFRCLSPDENMVTFTYSWAKNGRPINKADEEIVEGLLPVGSRLLVKNTRISTNYTCHVTNRAGTSSTTVHLFVIEADKSIGKCPSSGFQGVMWNQTFGGFFNMQKCPTDAADVIIRGLGEVQLLDPEETSSKTCLRTLDPCYTKRWCDCDEGVCKWGKPNYIRCQSVHLIEIYDMLRQIELGYQENPLMEIYEKLYDIVKQARNRMFAGDLDITAKSLYMTLTTARDFPTLATKMFNVKDLVDFLNILLEETVNLTAEEKRELLVGGRLIQISEIMVEIWKSNLINLTNVENGGIYQKLTELSPIPAKERVKLKRGGYAIHRHDLSIKSKRVIQASNEPRNPTKSTVPTDVVMTMRFDHSILPLLDRGKTYINSNETFISDVYSFIPLANTMNDQSKDYIIEIQHSSTFKFGLKNTTQCLSWEKKKRDDFTGFWDKNICTPVEVLGNMTRCLCPLPGHFTLVVIPFNQTVEVPVESTSHLLLILSCTFSLFCLTLALGTYLIAWRHLQEEKHNIHFNFILSVTGINLVCLICLSVPEKELMCTIGKVLLQLFTMASFTFLLLDAIMLFANVHARTHARVTLGVVKFFIIGWGVPTLSVVCVILMMEVVGYDKQCSCWCWWTRSHHHFYSVFTLMVILMVGHAVVLVFCIVIIAKWNDEWRYRNRRESLFELARSEILVILVIILVIVGVELDDSNGQSGQIVFFIFNLLLTTGIVLILVIFKKPMKSSLLLFLTSFKSPNNKQAKNLPGNQEAQARAAVEHIHEFCDRVDRERYTNEHKRQLRFLLNSSSSSGSSSGGASGPACKQPLRLGSKTAKGSRRIRNDHNLDSGISEGTESEKSSTPPQEDLVNNTTDSVKPLSGDTNYITSDRPPTTRKCHAGDGKTSRPKKKTEKPYPSSFPASSSASSLPSIQFAVPKHKKMSVDKQNTDVSIRKVMIPGIRDEILEDPCEAKELCTETTDSISEPHENEPLFPAKKEQEDDYMQPTESEKL